jgi:hypothetical protein
VTQNVAPMEDRNPEARDIFPFDFVDIIYFMRVEPVVC